MIIRQPKNVNSNPVNMEGAKNVTMKLLISRADDAPNFAMRQFIIAPRGHTPLHTHNFEHEVIIMSGQGTVTANDKITNVTPNTIIYVPPNELHQFNNTGDTPFILTCLVPISYIDSDGTSQPTPGS